MHGTEVSQVAMRSEMLGTGSARWWRRSVVVKALPVETCAVKRCDSASQFPADVVELCRRAGIEDLDVETSGDVLWIGGGPQRWEPE
jgi:hypothetical protein